MKAIFDTVSQDCSKVVTESYSTSFALATKMLSPSMRGDIYNIYVLVRFADEIVDSKTCCRLNRQRTGSVGIPASAHASGASFQVIADKNRIRIGEDCVAITDILAPRI